MRGEGRGIRHQSLAAAGHRFAVVPAAAKAVLPLADWQLRGVR